MDKDKADVETGEAEEEEVYTADYSPNKVAFRLFVFAIVCGLVQVSYYVCLYYIYVFCSCLLFLVMVLRTDSLVVTLTLESYKLRVL